MGTKLFNMFDAVRSPRTMYLIRGDKGFSHETYSKALAMKIGARAALIHDDVVRVSVFSGKKHRRHTMLKFFYGPSYIAVK